MQCRYLRSGGHCQTNIFTGRRKQRNIHGEASTTFEVFEPGIEWIIAILDENVVIRHGFNRVGGGVKVLGVR